MDGMNRMDMCKMDEDINNWLEENTEALIRDISRLVAIPGVAVENHEAGNRRPDAAKAHESEAHESEAPYGLECRKVLAEGEALFKRYGFKSHCFQNKLISCCYGEGKSTLGIWVHLDVVPATGTWRYDPFTCVREGDFLIGRGTQDNKGPAVAALYALRYIKERNIPLHYKVTLYLGSCEETGMTDVEDYLKENEAPDFSFIADCGFPVCYGEKGIIEAELYADNILENIRLLAGGTVTNSIPDAATAVVRGGEKQEDDVLVKATGISGHVAFPDGAVNAIGALAKRLLAMAREDNGQADGAAAIILTEKERGLCEFLACICRDGYGTGLGLTCRDSISGRLTASCSVIETAQRAVTLKLNIRYPIRTDSGDVKRKLENAADRHHFQLKRFHDSPPSYYDPGSPKVKCLMEVYQEETGLDTPAYVMGGGTYARKIPRAAGFGPGLPADLSSLNLKPGEGGCHAVNEAQSLSNLKKAIKIYIKAILKLNQIEGEKNYENNFNRR